MCMINGADPPDFYESQLVKAAKKAHECAECFRVIAVGESYVRATGRWDGRFDVFKTCRHCQKAQEWLLDECGGYAHGGCLEDLEEHVQERVGGWKVARMAVWMRRQWKLFTRDELVPVPA